MAQSDEFRKSPTSAQHRFVSFTNRACNTPEGRSLLRKWTRRKIIQCSFLIGDPVRREPETPASQVHPVVCDHRSLFHGSRTPARACLLSQIAHFIKWSWWCSFIAAVTGSSSVPICIAACLVVKLPLSISRLSVRFRSCNAPSTCNSTVFRACSSSSI